MKQAQPSPSARRGMPFEQTDGACLATAGGVAVTVAILVLVQWYGLMEHFFLTLTRLAGCHGCNVIPICCAFVTKKKLDGSFSIRPVVANVVPTRRMAQYHGLRA